METTTLLVATAQIAVAIAGFAGVVAMFRSESVHRWGRVERFWLRLLLLNSILPLMLSLFGLFSAVVAPISSSTWRWSSGFAALCLVPYAAMIIRNLAGFAPGQLKAAGGGRITSYSLVGLLIAVCVMQMWNVATVGAFWPFFAAVVLLIFGAMFQFVRLVLAPQPSETQS